MSEPHRSSPELGAVPAPSRLRAPRSFALSRLKRLSPEVLAFLDRPVTRRNQLVLSLELRWAILGQPKSLSL